MYPFDLERALAGEECFYRSEYEREDFKIINVFDAKDESRYPISIIYLGVHQNAEHEWFMRGDCESQGLFMKYPPKENKEEITAGSLIKDALNVILDDLLEKNKEEIKTAPFDFDYALKGHALITRDKRKIKDFIFRPYEESGKKITFNTEDNYYYEFDQAKERKKILAWKNGHTYGLFRSHPADLMLDITSCECHKQKEENPKMYPFDLKRALNGHELVTRNGITVSDFRINEDSDDNDDYPFCFTDSRDDGKGTCTAKGKFYSNGYNSLLDLFMKYEKDK